MSRVKESHKNAEQNEHAAMLEQNTETKKKFWPLLTGVGISIMICVWIAMLASKEAQPAKSTSSSLSATSTTLPAQQLKPLPTASLTMLSPTFKEDFGKGISNYWAYFLTLGKKDDVEISAQGEHLRISIAEQDTYAYLIYEKQIYKNVRIDAEITNQGNNNNNVGLICRFSKEGWYEFNISSSGVYSIYAYDNKQYRLIQNGGSELIHMNKATNQYRAECYDNSLTLYINHEKVWQGQDATFTQGMIGISAAAKKYQPIKVDFEWIQVTKQE